MLQKKRDLYAEIPEPVSTENNILLENNNEDHPIIENLNKSEKIDQSLDKLYLEFSDKTASLDDKEAVLNYLKKFLDQSQSNCFFF